MVMDKPEMDKVATNKTVMDKMVMVKVAMDKPDTAIKTITTMTTGVKIMGTKNNLMVDTRKRSMNTNKIDMVTTNEIKSMDTSKRGMDTNIQITNISNHLMEGTKRNLDMDKPVMDKPVMDKPVMDKPNMDKPNTEKPNMEKRAMIRPGPWHETPFY